MGPGGMLSAEASVVQMVVDEEASDGDGEAEREGNYDRCQRQEDVTIDGGVDVEVIGGIEFLNNRGMWLWFVYIEPWKFNFVYLCS